MQNPYLKSIIFLWILINEDYFRGIGFSTMFRHLYVTPKFVGVIVYPMQLLFLSQALVYLPYYVVVSFTRRNAITIVLFSIKFITK